MIPKTTVLYNRTHSLTELTELISTDEAAIGFLVALGHTATKTAATFEMGFVPEDSISMAEYVDDAVNIPNGRAKICDGYVWVGNNPAKVVAYR